MSKCALNKDTLVPNSMGSMMSVATAWLSTYRSPRHCDSDATDSRRS